MATSDYGLKISLPGYDVNTATPEQCAVHSSYSTPKIRTNASPAHFGVSTYTFSVNPAANTITTLLTVAHGYSYTPAALVYCKDVTAGTFSILPLHLSGNFASQERITYSTDSTNLKIEFYADISDVNVNGRSFTFKFYIFAESGS